MSVCQLFEHFLRRAVSTAFGFLRFAVYFQTVEEYFSHLFAAVDIESTAGKSVDFFFYFFQLLLQFLF